MIWMLVLVVIRNFILSSSGAKNTVCKIVAHINKFSGVIKGQGKYKKNAGRITTREALSTL